MDYSGIYRITNKHTGEFYGGSSVNIQKRWGQHKANARKGSSKCPILYNAMRKYGIENFSVKPLFRCSPTDLEFFEQRWLDRNVGLNECYNLAKFSDNPTRGRQLSESHKQALRRPKHSSEKMGRPFGYKMSDDHKKNIGSANRGKKYNCDRRGEKAANAKLTPDQVLEIRSRYIPRVVSCASLSKEFGVCPTTIRNIVTRYQWTNL